MPDTTCETPGSTLQKTLDACMEGDTEAFRRLVDMHHGYAYSLAVRFLGNHEDAEDVVQETFIRVWKHLHTFDYRCKFTTWMYRIVINLCRDRIKSRKRHEKKILPDTGALTQATDLENTAVQKELALIISSLAAQLPQRQQAVFILRDLQDLGMEEVSRVLGISRGAVKSNLCHARRNIRQRLEKLESPQVKGGL